MVGFWDVGLARKFRHLEIIAEWEHELVRLIIVIGAGLDELSVVSYAEGDDGSRATVLPLLHSAVFFVYYYGLIQPSL